MSNANLMGVTLFALAAPDSLEDIFSAIAKLLSMANSGQQHPPEAFTATARATNFPQAVRQR